MSEHKGMYWSQSLNKYTCSADCPACAALAERAPLPAPKLRFRLIQLAEKWDSANYAIEQINNPLLPQEQCAIELRKEIEHE